MIRRPSYNHYLTETKSKSYINLPENTDKMYQNNYLFPQKTYYQQDSAIVVDNYEHLVKSTKITNTNNKSDKLRHTISPFNNQFSQLYVRSPAKSIRNQSPFKDSFQPPSHKNSSFLQVPNNDYPQVSVIKTAKKQRPRVSIFENSNLSQVSTCTIKDQIKMKAEKSRSRINIIQQKSRSKCKQGEYLTKSKIRRIQDKAINYLPQYSYKTNFSKTFDYFIKESQVNSPKTYLSPNYKARQADLNKSQRIRTKEESSLSPFKNKENTKKYVPIKCKKRSSEEQQTTSQISISQIDLYKSSMKKSTKDISSPSKMEKFRASLHVGQISIKKKKRIGIEDFILGKQLGKGRFGVVWIAFHKHTGAVFALKKVLKSTIKSNMMVDQFLLQIKIQSYLESPYIVKIYGLFDDEKNIYLLLEYLQGGTLYEEMKKNTKNKICELETSQKIGMLCQAVKVLYEKGIVHRDIKPENIIITNGICKLGDFGWATFCDQRRKTYCGTTDYVAPEIVEGLEYDTSVDLWCVGVLVFELLSGKAPFYHISRQQTFNRIKNVEESSIVYPEYFSKEAIDFISNLIRKDPVKRMNMVEALKHPFIQKYQ